MNWLCLSLFATLLGCDPSGQGGPVVWHEALLAPDKMTAQLSAGPWCSLPSSQNPQTSIFEFKSNGDGYYSIQDQGLLKIRDWISWELDGETLSIIFPENYSPRIRRASVKVLARRSEFSLQLHWNSGDITQLFACQRPTRIQPRLAALPKH